MAENNLSSVEKIKMQSDGLRGTIEDGLRDEITGAISEDDQALIKFHGMYQQDDRDRRDERAEKKLERLYSFMIRLRLPGGFLLPEQWIAMHHVAGEFSTGIIKITTRQTIQLHGLLKRNIRPTIESFSGAKLDSIATCGDINRNVLCSAHPKQSRIHERVFAYADAISQRLMPKTKAYYEIWLNKEKISDTSEEQDPLYQDRYLPRKFKIAIGIPPNNDVDVFANDIALIAIIENNELKGFNIGVGGGLSTTHGNPETYGRLATVMGFCEAGEATLKTIYEVLTVQRDFGNRSDRKLARLKYTVDRMGIDTFKKEVEKRTGILLQPARPFQFTSREDWYGWEENHEGKWYYTVFVENGRVLDDGKVNLKTALLEVAKTGKANFRFTGNQNVILGDISLADKNLINEILEKYQIIDHTALASSVRKNAMACVAFNTCPLALAEAQRYLPSLLSKVEVILKRYSLQDEKIILRMTGCPNGCARPNLAEIGLIGTAYGFYNLHIGGDRYGTRLNRIYKQHLDEGGILQELDQLFQLYAADREKKESFGDFSIRKALV
ncbi:MAG TPA: NADPH-dependent assimilatory sulfite reductase hemoprotein subunit [Flavitalea sp.]|nr:NADPH-dependent assimilatory sulfite reductase hemoprotein subunit [Flavitalea sp.]